MHDHAGVSPDVEMAEPELLVDRSHQTLYLAAAVLGNLHVEGAGEMQRLDLVHPRERDLIVGPLPFRDDGDLILAGSLERPVVVGSDGLHDGQRMISGINNAFEQGHAVSTSVFLISVGT
jgi:hypothetical protein